MRNEMIEALFVNVVHVEQVATRQWVVTVAQPLGRDLDGAVVVDTHIFWVKVSRAGKVSIAQVGDDLV